MPEKPNTALVEWSKPASALTFKERQFFALVAAKSKLYGTGLDEAKALVKIQMGAEIGLGAAAALKHIQIIDGTPSFSASLIAARIKQVRPRYDFRVVELTPKGCTLSFLQDGEEIGRVTFNEEDAKRAKLLGKSNWSNYPQDMYFARALTSGARRYCPDVLMGYTAYTPEELGGQDEEVEDAEFKAVFTGQAVLTPEQVNVLKTMAAESGADLGAVSRNLGAASIEQLPRGQYERAFKLVTAKKQLA